MSLTAKKTILKRSASSAGSQRPQAVKKPPLTHFLSLPIGHHQALREKWTHVSTALLKSSPPIPGLHETVILKPGSLHLTLGVLSLTSQKHGSRHHDNINASSPKEAAVAEEILDTVEGHWEGASSSQTRSQSSGTVENALCLLRTLKIPIQNILAKGATDGNGRLRVPLERMDVMRSRQNQKPEQSHVLWAGPDESGEAGKRLKCVCDLIHSTFKDAGMLQDDRPLKLHCTLINTIYRKEKRAGEQKDLKSKRRLPFSFAAILSSEAYAQIATPSDIDAIGASGPEPRKVDLGSWPVDEVQLCEMGSKDMDGAYRSIGAIELHASCV